MCGEGRRHAKEPVTIADPNPNYHLHKEKAGLSQVSKEALNKMKGASREGEGRGDRNLISKAQPMD